MRLDKRYSQDKFWRLSLRQIFFLTALYALMWAGWMFQLRAERDALSKASAGTIATAEALQLNQSLCLALKAERPELIPGLLRAGANPNYSYYSVSSGGNESVLTMSINNGDLASLRLLLAAGAHLNVGQPDVPLISVIRSDTDTSIRLQMLRVLIDHGADVNRGHSSIDGSGVMEAAIDRAAPELIAVLRESGISYGPREMAIGGRIDELRAAIATDAALINRPVNIYFGCKTLLGIALARGDEKLANWLLDAGASLEIREVHQMSAMHMAAIRDCAAIIPRLLAAGCDVNAGDIDGDPPLAVCIRKSTPETVQALIEAGADVNKPGPWTGKSPLDRAEARYESSSDQAAAQRIITLLIKAGAKPGLKGSF